MIKKFFQKNKVFLLLLLILGVALFFRLYKLSNVPPSLNWDEISHGFNAYSILKTGKDEWGISLPLIFRAYGDFKLPLYIYLTVLSIAGFGLNVLSVRLISVLSGVGLVALAYWMTKRITKNDTLSLLAAFLTAVSPWSLFLSRIAVEANLGAFLFALGIYFFLRFREQKEGRNLWLTALVWGLSLYAYNSARILVPLFALLVSFLVLKSKKKAQLVIFALILVIFFIPVLGQMFFDKSGRARFNWVSLVDQGVVNEIVLKREESKLPDFAARFVYNRPAYFVYAAVRNYLSNLSLRYLFLRGGSHYQFSLPQHELLFLVTAPFLLLGLIKALKGNLDEKILVFWFFAAFIPSAITKDSPHVLRTIFILPSPMILSALGLGLTTEFLKEHKSKFKGGLVIAAFMVAVLVSFARWGKDYMTVYPKAYSWAWQYGYGQAVDFIKENYPKYSKVFVTKRYGEPHEFILFNFPWEPAKYQNDPAKKWDFHSDWYWVDGFDKFVFLNDWEVVGKAKCETRSERCLLITSPGNYPEDWNWNRDKIETLNFLDGSPVFDILEKK